MSPVIPCRSSVALEHAVPNIFGSATLGCTCLQVPQHCLKHGDHIATVMHVTSLRGPCYNQYEFVTIRIQRLPGSHTYAITKLNLKLKARAKLPWLIKTKRIKTYIEQMYMITSAVEHRCLLGTITNKLTLS